MGNSLQDQLLKAGLVSELEVAKAQERQDRSVRPKRGPRPERARGAGQPSTAPRPDERGKEGRRPKGGEPGDARKPRRGKGQGTGKATEQRKPEVDKAKIALASRPDAIADVALRSAKRRTEDLIKDGKLRSHSPEKREREVKRQRTLRIIERERKDRGDASVPHNFVRGTRIKRIYFTPEQRGQFVSGAIAVIGFEGRYSLVGEESLGELLEINPDLFVHRYVESAPQAAAEGEDEDYPPVPDDLIW